MVAVVTEKVVGDGAGNGFGEQSQVRGCGKKNSKVGEGGGSLGSENSQAGERLFGKG